MKKEDDIEDLFKESFDNYEPEVRPKVWKNVRVGLKWGSVAFFINAFINKLGTTTLIAIITSIAAIIGITAVMTWPKDDTNKTENTTIVSTVDSNAVSEKVTEENTTTENTNKSESTVKTTNSDPSSKEKTETAIKESLDETVATISANAMNGTAPLIVELSNTGIGTKNKWFIGTEKNTTTSTNPVHIFDAPGTYTILLNSSNNQGKTDVDTLLVTVTENPEAAKGISFTPNGDGKDDEFVLQSKKIAHMSTKIFDKKGVIIYQSEGTDAKWNGKDTEGKDAPAGIYYYLIHAQSVSGKKSDSKGAVQLIR
jgi:gliding motility-associated-like protein